MHVGPDLPQRLGGVAHVLEGDGHRALAGERHPPGEHLVEHHADRVDVRGGIHVLPLRLLRREVLGGAHDRPGLGHLRGTGTGDAEVRDLQRVIGRDDHVVGLEVAVHHAPAVREPGGAQDLDPERDRPLLRQRRLGAQQIPERAPRQVLHDDVVGVVVLAAVVDADHVGVLEPRRGRGLAPEALHELLVAREPPVENLERNVAPELRVLGQIDVGHSPRPDPAADPVAAGHHRALGYLSHRRLPGAPA